MHRTPPMHFIRSYSAVCSPRIPLLRLGILLCGLVVTSHLLAQGESNPTGATGGFSGSIATAGGSFDPYERNASRSITDIVVPGAVIPFTYTRIWNSRGNGRDNWTWDIAEDSSSEGPPGSVANDLFHGGCW
jgi:hypothetical protein